MDIIIRLAFWMMLLGFLFTTWKAERHGKPNSIVERLVDLISRIVGAGDN